MIPKDGRQDPGTSMANGGDHACEYTQRLPAIAGHFASEKAEELMPEISQSLNEVVTKHVTLLEGWTATRSSALG